MAKKEKPQEECERQRWKAAKQGNRKRKGTSGSEKNESVDRRWKKGR